MYVIFYMRKDLFSYNLSIEIQSICFIVSNINR